MHDEHVTRVRYDFDRIARERSAAFPNVDYRVGDVRATTLEQRAYDVVQHLEWRYTAIWRRVGD